MLFNSKNIAFGLDIGDKSIKLVELTLIKNLRGKQSLTLTAFNESPVPAGMIENGEIKNAPEVVKIIKNCVKTAKGRLVSAKTVVASLPESQSYLKIISVPENKKGDISQSFVESILSQHFPIDAAKSYTDWQFIDDDKIMIAVAPKNIVDSFTSVIEQAGLIPLSLEMESIAISRALANSAEPDEKKYKIVMDLGATRSSIVAIFQNNPVLTLHIPLSGDEMTDEIAKAEKISFEKAEELKFVCGFDVKKCPAKIKKIISSIVASSIKKIDTGIHYINRLLRVKIDKIYICGGVAGMAKLAGSLSDGLKIKVRHANPTANITVNKKIMLSDTELLKYTTAIGLAERGTEWDVLIFNK
ncbi:MAG: pilus assembly protein PilM [bacterium]